MIVCSCNVLSDHEVRSAVHAAAPHTIGEVYGCLGCSAQCGRCARTIRKIMDEGLPSCPAGCSCYRHPSRICDGRVSCGQGGRGPPAEAIGSAAEWID